MTDRRDVIIKATLRVHSTLKVPVDVHDLSTTGFRCQCIHDLSMGAPVWLSIPNMAGLQALVKRRNEWMYGFMFANELHPAIFDHISRQYYAGVPLPSPVRYALGGDEPESNRTAAMHTHGESNHMRSEIFQRASNRKKMITLGSLPLIGQWFPDKP